MYVCAVLCMDALYGIHGLIFNERVCAYTRLHDGHGQVLQSRIIRIMCKMILSPCVVWCVMRFGFIHPYFIHIMNKQNEKSKNKTLRV